MWQVYNDKFLANLIIVLIMVPVFFSSGFIDWFGPLGAILATLAFTYKRLKPCFYFIDLTDAANNDVFVDKHYVVLKS